jgi:chromosome segregation ATPase
VAIKMERNELDNEVNELQNEVNASLFDITNDFARYRNELENVKARISIWQATIERGRLGVEKDLVTIWELQSQLASNEALAAERIQNNGTQDHLKKVSEELDSIRSALETSESKFRDLHA